MTYKINKTDGSLLVEVIDSAIDTSATDLALIGKNVTGYGEYINENFVKLLENFASTSEPNNPITGQLWFDVSENRLKVYDGINFRIGSGPIVSGSAPLTPIQGDFWIDSDENQLYFYDGTDRVLAGPIYKDSQGISGFEVDTIGDTDGNSRVIVKLWASQVLMGIWSKYDEFTPASLIPGFAGTIKPGFNASTLDNLKFHGRATSADNLVDELGNLKPSSSFMYTDEDNTTTGSITISNPEPLVLGVGQENTITVNATEMEIRSNSSGQDFKIITRQGTTFYDALALFAASKRAGIFNANPQATLHNGDPANGISGDVIIEGNLTVNGTTTTVNSTELSVDDKNITLGSITPITGVTGTVTATSTTTTVTGITSTAGMIAGMGFTKTSGTGAFGGVTVIVSVDSLSQITILSTTANTAGAITFNVGSSDTLANDGGITLVGATNKTFQWKDNTDSWTANQNIDIGFSNSYKVNGVDVLSRTTLGTGVVNSSLTSLGTLTLLRVGNLQVSGNTIISTNTNGDILLDPNGIGNVGLVGTPRITGLGDPVNNRDAVNKQYLTSIIGPVINPWQVISTDYVAAAGERLLISTNSGPVSVVLPENPSTGDQVRFIDLDGTFDTNNLTVKRYRRINLPTLGGTSSFTAVGTYTNVVGTAITGPGTGMRVNITLTANGTTYTSSNTTITIVNHGVDFLDGNTVKILGTALGGASPANDLVFDLDLDNILSQNDDLVLTKQDNAFGLIYVNTAQGWKYAENLDIVGGVITADLVGNVTGNVTGDVTGELTGNVIGDVTGNVSGDVFGDLFGDVTGDVTGNVTGNVTGDVTGNLTGDVTGNITGDINTNNILASVALQLSAARNIELAVPLQIKSYDTATRNTLAYKGLIYNSTDKLLQYYDGVTGVWQNVGTDQNNSLPRLKLPTFTAGEIGTLSSVQTGEVVFNSTTSKAQVFDGVVWQDLW